MNEIIKNIDAGIESGKRKAELSEFEVLARPLMEYLNNNHHPHHHIVITPIRAELLEGVVAFTTYDYVQD